MTFASNFQILLPLISIAWEDILDFKGLCGFSAVTVVLMVYCKIALALFWAGIASFLGALSLSLQHVLILVI